VPQGQPIDYTEEDLVAVPASGVPPVASGTRPSSSRQSLARLAIGRDMHRFPLTSDRPLARWTVLPVKRALRRLLHPVLARQVEFNAAVTGAVETLWDELGELRADHQAAHVLTSVLHAELIATRDAVERIEASLEMLERRIQTPPPA
jgi:hypothetical protein